MMATRDDSIRDQVALTLARSQITLQQAKATLRFARGILAQIDRRAGLFGARQANGAGGEGR